LKNQYELNNVAVPRDLMSRHLAVRPPVFDHLAEKDRFAEQVIKESAKTGSIAAQ
jgi:hypothetical protein